MLTLFSNIQYKLNMYNTIQIKSKPYYVTFYFKFGRIL